MIWKIVIIVYFHTGDVYSLTPAPKHQSKTECLAALANYGEAIYNSWNVNDDADVVYKCVPVVSA